MNHKQQKIHKCFKNQKRTARTAISCLLLLLLYGCANQGQAASAISVLTEESVLEDGISQTDRTSKDEIEDTMKADESSADRKPSSDEDQVLTVYVCGAVRSPGVYELRGNSRVYEAVALAGGMTKDAALAAVNQAELLSDGQMIVIPTKEEQQAISEAEEAREEGLVNINSADLEELKTLPGIGDSKARSILAYREKKGAFQTIEDIKNVEGIGDGVFAKLENCIKVD